MTSFSFAATIHFRDADPAGILFFGNVYALAHDAYEKFVSHLGFEYRTWFENDTWAVPIRHSSCDYQRPLPAGCEVEIQVKIEDIGSSSFTALYAFKSAGQICCEVKLVHAFMDKKSRAKTEIPSAVRGRLESYRSEGLGAQ